MDKIIIGLTGQSGAGKSTIASVFQQSGFFLIDADLISRKIVNTVDVLNKLKELFGNDIMSIDNCLNRKALAKIVFSDKVELEKLNQLLFPIIFNKIKDIIDNSDAKYILLDAPQLFESNANQICDKIISVVTPHNVLVARIMSRDGIDKIAAENRLNAQLPETFFVNNSDFIIVNTGTEDELVQKTRKLIETIVKM